MRKLIICLICIQQFVSHIKIDAQFLTQESRSCGSTSLDSFNSRKYFDSYPLKANWFLALKFCRNIGMDLISIETEKKEMEIEAYIRRRPTDIKHEIWTSGTDYGMSGMHYWMSTGNLLTYKKWMPNQPSGHYDDENENCLALRKTHNNGTIMWNDSICSSELEFICEAMERRTIDEEHDTTKKIKNNKEDFFFSFPVKASWNNANRFCILHNQKLISIESMEKQTKIETFLSSANHKIVSNTNDTNIWTSGVFSSTGHYWTSNGQNLVYLNWANGEDDKLSDNNGIAISKELNDTYHWYNLNLNLEFYFICE